MILVVVVEALAPWIRTNWVTRKYNFSEENMERIWCMRDLMSMPHTDRPRHDPRATVATNHIVPRGEARIAKKKQKGKIAKAGSQTRNLHFTMDTTYH